MPPKKINLKSSVSTINAKVAVGKKKTLNKLKVILANPYKPKYETLIYNELAQFKELISSEIKLSGMSGRLFARQNNIQLGLGSSLRAIRNKKASCVLVSQSIKPNFIIHQIRFFAKQSNSTLPVFIVDDWDKITADLFGVRSLIVVFPSNISGELGKWIEKRTLLKKDNQKPTKNEEPYLPDLRLADVDGDKKINLNSMYLRKPCDGSRTFVPNVVVKSKPITENESRDWTGDFISFSNHNESGDKIKMDMDEIDEEFKRKQDKALDILENIAKRSLKIDIKPEPKTNIKCKDETPKRLVSKKEPNTDREEWENDTSYISLEVHKIQPNPKRKPKNKKQKKVA